MERNSFDTLSTRETSFIKKEMSEGKYGHCGDAFMTTRALAEARGVSLVTAHQILNELCAEGYLELRGKRYYIVSKTIKAEEESTRRNIIGLLVPVVKNEFYSSLSDAVIEICKRNGYHTLLFSTSYSAEEEAQAIQLLSGLSLAGLISCVPSAGENRTLYEKCALPCVMLGHSIVNSTVSSVQVNSLPVSQKIARHLVDEGYQKFLYFGTKNLSLDMDVRYIGYQMELKNLGFTLEPTDAFQLATNIKNDDKLIMDAIERQDEPVGIFCYHDLIAARVYYACYNLGKKIPDDVGIVGFDDLSSTARYLSLSTVRYRISTMAEMAVNLLLTSITTASASYDNYYIEPSLVIRKSSSLSSASGKKSAPASL